jgi:beta-galactosidase
MLYMTDEKTVSALSEFVSRGGVLYATYMLGMVDESDLCHLGGFPAGPLKEVFGIWNEEIDTLYPSERVGVLLGGDRYLACDYCECVHLRGAEALASYAEEFYADMPALTVNGFGKGKAYYQAFRDTGEFFDRVIGEILDSLSIASPLGISLPDGMTVHERTDGEDRYFFVENHSGKPACVTLPQALFDLELGEAVESLALEPYDARILKA